MTIKTIIVCSLLTVAAPGLAQTPQAAATAAPSAAAPTHYTTTDTDIGTLMDDPASMAVLTKHFPEMFKSDQINQARSMTLKEIQAYSSDMLTDQALASTDADLAKVTPKK